MLPPEGRSVSELELELSSLKGRGEYTSTRVVWDMASDASWSDSEAEVARRLWLYAVCYEGWKISQVHGGSNENRTIAPNSDCISSSQNALKSN